MKVLLHNRDKNLWVGGDAVQVENTMQALRRKGVEVTFTSDTFLDPRAFDLVHCFHLNFFWTTPMMQECYLKKVPYIVSTVYYDGEYDNSFRAMAKLGGRASHLVALSKREKDELINRFQFDPDHISIISNGVDPTIFHDTQYPDKQGVIAVGRLSDQAKGAEFVIEACYQLGIPLTYIGMSQHSTYSKTWRSKCNHIEHVSQVELAKLLNQAKVYCCSSLGERQSLGVLEAHACGCNIVDSIHNRGADLLPSSVIVDPQNMIELKHAIEKQMAADKQIDPVPTWDQVADQLIKLYEQTTRS